MFLEVIGYLSFSEKDQSLVSLSLKKFDKAMKYLAKSEKQFKLLNIKSAREQALYLITKARVAYLSKDYILAQSLLEEAYSNTFNMENIQGSLLKDTFIFSIEMMKIQTSVASFIQKLEQEVLPYNQKLINNKKQIDNIIAAYDNQIMNSKEHLNSSRLHLELVVDNANIEAKIEDFLDSEIKSKGENLLYQINFVLNKMLNNHLLKKDETGRVFPGNKSRFPMFIYIYLMIEKLKINYYLRNKEQSIQDVAEIVSILINLNHDDPLGVICGEVVPLEIYHVSSLSDATLFVEYMKSFQIKLYKASKSLKFFNLTMFAQQKCETKEDRLKLFWVSEKEIYEMDKNETASQG